MSARIFRLFVSSPGDVAVERRRVAAVVSRLNGEFAGRAQIDTIRWETENYQAFSTFQAQIPHATACDIVIGIFKWRVGTQLPPEFPDRLETGEPYPSGTAYEILTSIARRQQGGELPDIFVYRYGGGSPHPELDDPNRVAIERDWGFLKSFFERWFLTPAGHFKAAFNSYGSEDDFEAQVERLLRRWLADKVLAGRVVTWPDAVLGSPFPGLLAYGRRHAAVFFGRSRDVTRAVDLWREAGARGTPFLLVVGASGAGKSSLARAGLEPRLTTPGVVEAVDLWRIAALRPGDGSGGPVAALAQALFATGADLPPSEEGRGPALPEIAGGDARTPAELADILAHGSRTAARTVVNALDRVGEELRSRERQDRPVRCDLVLLVDQLDEIFAPSVQDADRDSFVAALAALLGSGRVWLLATLRADLYAAMLAHPGLAGLKERGAAYDLAPPGAAELAEIVRRPAEAAGLSFEQDPATGEAVDERLLREADRPDMLPLVQLALARLYEGRRQAGDRTVLPAEIYAGLGGLTGIIDEAGERALGGLAPAEAAHLPRLIRSLAELGHGGLAGTLTARAVPLAEAAPDSGRRRLVDALVAARLLTVSGADEGGQVRLAHQRMLTDWARARDIVASSQDFYRIRQEVERQRLRWAANRRGDLLLPRGLPLAEAESMVSRFGEEVGPETRTFIRASRARAGRAQLLTGIAAAIFAAAAAGALLEWRVADRQTRLAEQNFGVAREAVKGLVFNIAQGLRDVTGMRVEAVRQILETVQAASDQLIATAPDDPELLRSRAAMFDNFGRTYLAAGDVTAARRSAEGAVAILRRLLVLTSDRPGIDGDLSVVLSTLGTVVRKAGDPTAAIGIFREALASARRGVARMPGDIREVERVGNVLDKLGGALLDAGDQAAALAAYEELLAGARAAVAASPADPVRRRHLAVALSAIGGVKLGGRDVAGARAAYEEAAEIGRRLAEETPADAATRHSLSVSLTDLGDLDLQTEQARAALARYDAALAIERELSRLDPGSTARAHDLGVVLEKRGDALLALDDLPAARLAFEEELGIFRRLVTLDPSDAAHLGGLATVLDRIAAVADRQGRPADASEARGQGLSIRRGLVARQPGSAAARHDLSVSLQDVGDASRAAGDVKGAIASYQEALAISRDLAAADRSNPRAERDILGLTATLAAMQAAEGDTAGALATYGIQAAAFARMAELRPGEPNWRRGLAQTYLTIGSLQIMTDWGEALKAVAEAVAIYREVAASGDPVARRDLPALLSIQGRTALGAGDRALALAAYRDAVRLRREMAGSAPGKVALAAALLDLAGLDPDPEPLLREAETALAALGEGDMTPRGVELRQRIGEQLAASRPKAP